MKIAVILPAAGQGKRFADAQEKAQVLAPAKSKLEQPLEGRPIFLRAVELFLNFSEVAQIILAVNPDQVDAFKVKWGDKLAFHDVKIVPGGKSERWETVQSALEYVAEDCTHAAIHDAARPLTSRKLIDRVFDAASKYPAVIPAVPVSATLKRVAPATETADQQQDPLDAILGSAGKPQYELKRVTQTIDRTDLVQVQTPQVFELSLLRRAYAQIPAGKVDAASVTDDAGLVEALGETVYVIQGDSTNLKITRPDDLDLAAALISRTQGKDTKLTARKRLFADEDDD